VTALTHELTQLGTRSFHLHLLVKAISLWELEAVSLEVKDLRESKASRVPKVFKVLRDLQGLKVPLDLQGLRVPQDLSDRLVLLGLREP